MRPSENRSDGLKPSRKRRPNPRLRRILALRAAAHQAASAFGSVQGIG
ncbi:hypothetical protein [Kingella potus]|nr:hypothetical protein [Kingella potus]UOP00808.1 hypothetical protein LVJ84_13840 [Kingella potus]